MSIEARNSIHTCVPPPYTTNAYHHLQYHHSPPHITTPHHSPPCSAGVGRTSALIAITAMMEMIAKKEEVNVFSYVMKMRASRSHMVQTEVGRAHGWHLLPAVNCSARYMCTYIFTVLLLSTLCFLPINIYRHNVHQGDICDIISSHSGFTSAYCFTILLHLCPTSAPPLPHPVLYPPPQKQYVFIHDALVEFIKSRSHLITAAELKARVANMAAVNPETNMTGFQQEYQVSTHHVHSGTGPWEKKLEGQFTQYATRSQ